VVVDGFGAAEIVNADDQGTEVLERANGFQSPQGQANGHKGNKERAILR